MKKIFATLIIFLSTFSLMTQSALAYVQVKGYYRSNGTYVKPHVRSSPNGLKYDNYGYKPSQGLYNDSYGTRGSYWDTPTYITDPDYYTGKSIYDSSSTSSLLNNESYGSLLRSNLDTTPSYVSSYSSSLLDYDNYKLNSDCSSSKFAYMGECYKLPKHAEKDYISDYICDDGYIERGNGKNARCEIEIPENETYEEFIERASDEELQEFVEYLQSEVEKLLKEKQEV